MCLRGESGPKTTSLFRARCPPGVLPLRFRVKPIARHQSIRAHRVDGPRRLFQRRHLLNCSDARRLSLARHGIRLASFRWVRAVPWQPPAGEHLPDSVIRSLLVARDGRLWIGTEKGLASWKDGKLTQYPELAGPAIVSLLEDREGTVWAGESAPPSGRLCAIHDGSARCYGEDGRFGGTVSALYEDSRGNLWAGVGDRAVAMEAGSAETLSDARHAAQL